MADHSNPVTALLSSTTAGISAVIAWISIEKAQVFVAFAASLVALGSGMLAARYYWYATLEKKQNLKNKKTTHHE